VRVIRDLEEVTRFEQGAVLVTPITNPDWVPLMKRASAIVTDHGGRTSHAAIVSRELGVPAVVGTGRATELLRDGQEVTVSCQGGTEGCVYEGRLRFDSRTIDVAHLPTTRTRVLMNIASPSAALGWWRLPVRGIGLARMEYLVNNVIRIHARFDQVDDASARARIEKLTQRYHDKSEYFVDQLAGDRPHRRLTLPGPGRGSDERLQDKRIREARRRQSLRAARGGPDARLARSIPVLRRGLP
jgi:pyruvate, water dikinase